MWKPRPLMGAWTPDQARIAAHFRSPPTPNAQHPIPLPARRVCVCAANGVGKTHLAADLAVSFLLDLAHSIVLTTAPTQRQVEELLWPQIRARLKRDGLWKPGHRQPEWEGPQGQRAIGFATNRAERLQGFHADQMLIIIDEASGMTAELLEAAEAIAVGEENYIFAIGNPNEPFGPFYELTRRPSYVQEHMSALNHPNILQRREVIPGATTWASLLDRLRDWCREVVEPIEGETFSLEVSEEELPAIGGGPTPSERMRHFLPNDAFRVRYLGLFPRAAAESLLSMEMLTEATRRNAYSGGRVVAALDVARTGGDRTIYALRRGETVVRVEVVPAAPLTEQAEQVHRLLRRDNPAHITIDAAGLGIGLIDYLRRLTLIPVREFHGSEPPLSPLAVRRYANRRAHAYANLASALQKRRVSLPNDPALLEELAAITFRHTPDGALLITPKEQIKAKTGRSPDLADAVSMLFEPEALGEPPRVTPRQREEIEW